MSSIFVSNDFCKCYSVSIIFYDALFRTSYAVEAWMLKSAISYYAFAFASSVFATSGTILISLHLNLLSAFNA